MSAEEEKNLQTRMRIVTLGMFKRKASTQSVLSTNQCAPILTSCADKGCEEPHLAARTLDPIGT